MFQLYAGEIEKLPEEDVALECLAWGCRQANHLVALGSYKQLDAEQRAAFEVESAAIDAEQLRLVAKYRPPDLSKLSPSSTEVAVSFRASKLGKGQVLVLRHTGSSRLEDLRIQVNSRAPVAAGQLDPAQVREFGWVELDHALQKGDRIEVWAGKRKVAISTVP
jgi:hypothetical protein